MVFFFFIVSFAKVASAQNRSVVVGNAVGETSSVDGPATIQVDMGDCQFSMVIGEDEHVKYNDPDLMLYRSNRPLADHDLPHLKQTEMKSGYDWWFVEPKTVGVQWVGLMCDNVSDFKWSSSPMRPEVSQELQDIMDSNSLKCPADFNGKKWISIQKNGDVSFENFDVIGASGFAIDNKKKNGTQGSQFCFVHGENVVIGVSGGGANLRGGKNSKTNLLRNVLRGIEFRFEGVPAGQ